MQLDVWKQPTKLPGDWGPIAKRKMGRGDDGRTGVSTQAE